MNLRRAALTASFGTAVFALLTFGVVHAVWLVPIWSRLLGGLPFTIVGALTLGWTYAELAIAMRLPRRPVLAGLVFGIGAWTALLPVTGIAAAFRVTGLHQAHPDLTSGVELITAGLTGVALGAAFRNGWRVTVALATSACVLLAVQAGPVSVLNGRRPAGLFVFLAGIYVACGIVQAVLTDLLETKRQRDIDAV